VGAGEPWAPAWGEATVKYHPDGAYDLTIMRWDRGWWGV
jgi:hypothetical protein